MEGAGAGAGQGPPVPAATEAAEDADPGAEPDWAGLPADLLAKVAETHIARAEAAWAARLRVDNPWMSDDDVRRRMAKRKREGLGLFVFARVCKGWRKAQLKVGGPLRTRVKSDVLLPRSVALAKWALAEGCPIEGVDQSVFGCTTTMTKVAARLGHLDLIKWLCGEQGFRMDTYVMANAATSGNLEMVQWLRGEGCPWDSQTCYHAVFKGHVEVLRWARANGAPWDAQTRDRAAAELGYTDNLGNLVTW